MAEDYDVARVLDRNCGCKTILDFVNWYSIKVREGRISKVWHRLQKETRLVDPQE